MAGVKVKVPFEIQRDDYAHHRVYTVGSEFFSEYRHRYELIGDVLKGQNTIAFQYKVCPRESFRRSDSPNAYRGAEFITLHGDAAIFNPSTDTRSHPHRRCRHRYAE